MSGNHIHHAYQSIHLKHYTLIMVCTEVYDQHVHDRISSTHTPQIRT